MNELQVFSNTEFGELGILTLDGKEYFPATACAKILGYANPQEAIRSHCKGVRKMLTPSSGGKQEVNFIPEGDLYRLIVRSKLPAAEQFERWVFDEVLPTIRKRGTHLPDMDIQNMITQTATAVATEVLKQVLPILQGSLNPSYQPMYIEELSQEPRPRKKVPSIIDRLNTNLRKDVEDMLCSGKYTYSDIVQYLGEQGIRLSAMAVCRYAKSML